ncbi:MAG: hypothetical protein U9N86_18225, partial [Bacteroidota bacterium]|nr:hypothetical protein [Bacteroidota bacterium]
ISAPASDKVYINELRQDINGELRRFWQPPQILPMRRFSIIGGEIYGHSNAVPETYKLFDGLNDNDKSFTAKAVYAYRHYNKKENYKNLDEWFTEGFIGSSTELTLKLNFDYGGSTQKLEETINGYDDDILFESALGGSLGDESLGGAPLGDQEEEGTDLPKFRSIKCFPPEDFFEIQAIYETDAKDAQWKILAHGGNIRIASNQPTSIKK